MLQFLHTEPFMGGHEGGNYLLLNCSLSNWFETLLADQEKENWKIWYSRSDKVHMYKVGTVPNIRQIKSGFLQCKCCNGFPPQSGDWIIDWISWLTVQAWPNDNRADSSQTEHTQWTYCIAAVSQCTPARSRCAASCKQAAHKQSHIHIISLDRFQVQRMDLISCSSIR